MHCPQMRSEQGVSFGVSVPKPGRTRRARCHERPLDSNPGSNLAFAGASSCAISVWVSKLKFRTDQSFALRCLPFRPFRNRAPRFARGRRGDCAVGMRLLRAPAYRNSCTSHRSSTTAICRPRFVPGLRLC
jgi:hypothetical protein